MIRLDNVTKIYKGDVTALKEASADIGKGEFVFLVGPSGSGKSTLIRLLNKEESPTDGEVWVAGKDINRLPSWKVPHLRRNIGCIYQDFKLLPTKTVYENVAFALEVIGRPRHVIKTQVPAILELVGLSKKIDNFPNELSGGEQQRVSIARAFVNRPLILLADEPTGNLDPATSVGIMRLLDRINRTGTTVVMATHDQSIVDTMRRRVDRARPRPDRARSEQGCVRLTMALRLDYFAQETVANLRRNFSLTIASLLTVAVSLALVGAALLLRQGVDNATTRWQGGIEFIVFLQPDVTPGPGRRGGPRAQGQPRRQRRQVRRQAAGLRGVQAPLPQLARARRHGDARHPPGLVASGAEQHRPERDRGHRSSNSRRRRASMSVVFAKDTVESVMKVTRLMQIGILGAAVVLLIAACLLIVNTIRTAMLSRRREIEVMKLVGASNWFIRVPFMLEGLVQGLLGAALGVRRGEGSEQPRRVAGDRRPEPRDPAELLGLGERGQRNPPLVAPRRRARRRHRLGRGRQQLPRRLTP